MIVRIAPLLLLLLALLARAEALPQERSPTDLSTRTFKEYDLAFKTDASGSGPVKGAPALVPTGRC